MSNLNAQLLNATLTLSAPTITGNLVSSSAANPSAKAMAAFYEAYRQTSTTPDSVSIPVSPFYVVYIRNLSASADLSVTLTPAGGSAWASPVIINPAGIFTVFQNYTTTPTTGGFTALTLLSSSGICPCEVFLAG